MHWIISLSLSLPQDIVVGMKFGQFGREEGSLILVSQSGAMTVKILKRNVVFEVKETKPGLYLIDTLSLQPSQLHFRSIAVSASET